MEEIEKEVSYWVDLINQLNRYDVSLEGQRIDLTQRIWLYFPPNWYKFKKEISRQAMVKKYGRAIFDDADTLRRLCVIMAEEQIIKIREGHSYLVKEKKNL